MIEIEAPDCKNTLFLAGTIDNGEAIDWQSTLNLDLSMERFDVLVWNPRRNNQDAGIGENEEVGFQEQVEWEHSKMLQSDFVFMYFVPGSTSIITCMELGLLAGLGVKPIVVCSRDFWRYGNVEYICNKYDILRFDTFEQGVKHLKIMLNQ